MDEMLSTFKLIEQTVRAVAKVFEKQPKQSDYTLVN
jgi:hypothetical protein